MPRSILVADPSVTIRRVVELTFSDSDVYVETASSGREALERIDRLRPDLVLVDVGLGDPSGYEICRTVKSSPRPVPVLLLAGAFEPFDEQQGAACGADGHLLKPFEARVLLQRVERLLADGVGQLPSVGRAQVTAPPPAEQVVLLRRDEIEALARAAIERLAEPLLRELAREVLPQVAERVVRERIRELESEEL